MKNSLDKVLCISTSLARMNAQWKSKLELLYNFYEKIRSILNVLQSRDRNAKNVCIIIFRLENFSSNIKTSLSIQCMTITNWGSRNFLSIISRYGEIRPLYPLHQSGNINTINTQISKQRPNHEKPSAFMVLKICLPRTVDR